MNWKLALKSRAVKGFKYSNAHTIREADKLWDQLRKEGGKVISAYWTIGRYDAIVTLEAPSERAALKALMRWGDYLNTETLVAVPREEVVKLVG